MAIWQWSKTATLNANSDPSMDWAEGIPPSIVNDNVRALMARIAEWRDDIGGDIEPTGTPPNYTLTSNQGVETPTPAVGTFLTFNVTVTNVGNDQLSVDGGNFYPLTIGGVGLPAGVLNAFTPYTWVFNGSIWVLHGVTATPFVVPIGGLIDYAGFAPPNGNFMFPAGQLISTTTYSTLFGLVGYSYGGSGSSFGLPDLRGRVTAGIDNMGGGAAGRIGTLSTDGGTIVGTTPGSAGGSQQHTQTNAEMTSHGHTGSGNVSDPTHAHGASGGHNFIIDTGSGAQVGGGGLSAAPNTAASGTGISVPSLNINANGSSQAMAWLQPTMMMNKILRVL